MDYQNNLVITDDIRSFLIETAKWAKLIAIVGFIMLGLSLFMPFIFMASIMPLMMSGEAAVAMGTGAGAAFFSVLLIIVLFIFPLLYLYKFGKNTQVALQTDDQNAISTAFQNLKSHYKFIGILLCIVIAFHALMIIISLGAMVFAG